MLTMEGVPADMGDWGIKRVFHEGGRLLSKHLRDFLPVILVFIFPAALIKVLHTQFFVADFCGPPCSSYIPDPTSSWLLFPLDIFWALPQLLITFAFVIMRQVLKDTIYTTDLKAKRHSQSWYTSLKLAFTFREGDQTGGSYEREASKGKKLKSFSALFLCYILYVSISLSGMNFTPEAVTVMGLPPWTIFLFTLLIVTVTTIITTYFLLVGLVMEFSGCGLLRRPS